MSATNRKTVTFTVSLGVTLALLLVAGWVFTHRQYIVDQLAVWNFTPSASVSALSSDLELTSDGNFYLMASRPIIQQADDFNRSCPQQEVNNPILGCYSEQRIYIYDVQNEKLNGIQQVTAAHEMLHAVWERMDAGEQKKVTALLDSVYQSLPDQDLKNRMDYYQRTEPGEFYNELHSIIGTEISSISPDLEAYYRNYFNDRQAIVAFHSNYSSVFQGLEDESNRLYQRLTELDTQITAERNQYDQSLTSLSSDISSFNARANSGSFSSNAAFYSERSALVARSNQLEVQRSTLNTLIEEYNQTYQQYKAIASQIQQLSTSIDSMSTAGDVPQLDQ